MSAAAPEATSAAVREATAGTGLRLDPDNPWLGLSSYSEETRAYFHGRDDEAAELARRVQRKLLTVLFGQSGLGKTSLLRAGLVPRLRREGFCPVYVRVDYAPDSPSAADQIKQAIFRASADAGDWTQAGVATQGESLWEFLHHRGDVLRDADGRTLLPLLIFDQFEEVFTLAQADDAGRLRARRFLEELADLVENRPPVALEQRIDRDEVDAGEFDFARADYRVLIALREDYLAHLEGLKSTMPSITQNRMRLARMTGAQALTAVVKPGGRLVSAEVAESIVRFVAGGSELANAEVEPSLLSLVCRELNLVRQAKGQAEISADLLAGSRETILSEFYERALADQPAGVRRVVEDELLTESGYRESLAEERVLKALAAAGAPAGALATLVDRRLLRIEDRLDVRRVELTHDVLCPVVKASRNVRHEREARDEAERQLAAQQARAAETRRTLKRTRRFAIAAGILSLVAIGSAIFGWTSWNRAKVADAQAQGARADAERLVAFLIEDFYEELQPTGRTETLGKLAHMAVEYYDGLPPSLLTPRTQVFRGMALAREGYALIIGGDIDKANSHLAEATQIFTDLRSAGDTSEATAVGLALAKFTRYSAWGPVGAPGSSPADLPEAIALLKPYVYAQGASRQAKLLYADMLNYVSHQRVDRRQGVADCNEARALLRGMGALDMKDLTAASIYADTADSQARHSIQLGLIGEAEQLEHEVGDIAEKVLAQRPGDMRSMLNRGLSASFLADIARIRNDYDGYEQYAERSLAAALGQIQLNPASVVGWDYLINAKVKLADADEERGRIGSALAKWQATVALKDDPRAPPSVLQSIGNPASLLALLQAETGHLDAAAANLRLARTGTVAALQGVPRDSALHVIYPGWDDLAQAQLDLLVDRPEQAYERSTALIARLRALPGSGRQSGYRVMTASQLYVSLRLAARAALRLGRGAEAERMLREVETLPELQRRPDDPRNAIAQNRVMLAHAIALQGRTDETLAIVEPELRRYSGMVGTGTPGVSLLKEYAYALYVSALAAPPAGPERAKRLNEALRQLQRVPGEAGSLRTVQALEARIREAQAGSA